MASIPPQHPDGQWPARHHGLTQLLHWGSALLVLACLALGLSMTEMPFSPTRLRLYNWHKWLGVTVLVASALRVLWTLLRPQLAPAPGPRWQQQAAQAVHGLMYLLLLALPLSGWAYSSAAGFPIVWLGLLPLPDWVPVDKGLADSLKQVHALLGYALAGSLALHIGAAVKHQWMDRDGLLERMLPRRRSPPPPPPLTH